MPKYLTVRKDNVQTIAHRVKQFVSRVGGFHNQYRYVDGAPHKQVLHHEDWTKNPVPASKKSYYIGSLVDVRVDPELGIVVSQKNDKIRIPFNIDYGSKIRITPTQVLYNGSMFHNKKPYNAIIQACDSRLAENEFYLYLQREEMFEDIFNDDMCDLFD